MNLTKNVYYTKTNEDNRIVMLTAIKQSEEQFEFEFPEGFKLSKISEYKIVDGELIHDPLPVPEFKPVPSVQERLDAAEAAILELAQMM